MGIQGIWVCNFPFGECARHRFVFFHLQQDWGCHVVRSAASHTKTVVGVNNVYRAFDLEKRQHLFANNIVQPLQPEQVGFYGMGRVDDLGVDIQKAEDELEKKWSQKQRAEDESEKLGSIRGSSLEPAVAGSKSDIFELHGGDDGSKQGQGNSFVT